MEINNKTKRKADDIAENREDKEEQIIVTFTCPRTHCCPRNTRKQRHGEPNLIQRFTFIRNWNIQWNSHQNRNVKWPRFHELRH